jgi:hypothetical protein
MKDRSNSAIGPTAIHSWSWRGMRVVGKTSAQTVQARLPKQAVWDFPTRQVITLAGAAHRHTSFDTPCPGGGANSVLSTHHFSCPLRSFIVPIVLGHFCPLERFQ